MSETHGQQASTAPGEISSAAVQIPPPLPSSRRASGRRLSRAWAVALGAWKYVVGVFLTQSLLLSFVAVGWTYRLMQRVIYRRWWASSTLRRNGITFDDFIARIPELKQHAHAPNWIVGQHIDLCREPAGWRGWVEGFRVNAKTGVQAVFNTWVLTLPACVLMLFSWAFGWTNSFTKGYELAFIGPATGVLGLAAFIAALLYVLIAQAHQAATGKWRAFYQWRFVWRVARRQWFGCLLLAVAYSVISVPVTAYRIVPYYWPQIKKLSPEYLASVSPEQIEQQLGPYFLGGGLVVFAAFITLRVLAARLYAGGVLRSIRAGDIPPFALDAVQHAALERLGHLSIAPASQHHPILAFAGRLASFLARGAAWFAFVFVWFTFAAQIYIANFLNYVPVLGWLNQPLVQLPWIKYIPHKTAGELWALLLVTVVVLAWLTFRSALRHFTR